nr:SpoIIE family protein phosphatase [Peterkaempfera griseoplana]
MPDPAGPGAVGHYRVLLVEDDAGDALLVEELLADTGLQHTLVWRQTLAEARSELASAEPDCVLLDLHLPDTTGTRGVTEIQRAAPHAAVIVLTGLAESQAGVEAVAAGAQDYLVKGSVEPALLQRALRYAVHRKHTERANAELQANRLRAEENARLERGLLPKPLLSGSSLTATTRYLPGRERTLLGGDFLDAVETDDGFVHAVIGDVSGHGPDEAALGVSLRITWRALTLAGHRGVALLDLLEQMLVAERTRDDTFATCALLTLDPARTTAEVHLAGHHEPLLTTAGTTRVLTAEHGVALGIAPGLRHWFPTTLTLPATGALTLYTDGLIEGHTGRGDDRLGIDGLLAIIEKAANIDVEGQLDHLVSTVRGLNAGRHADDLAILRLDWCASSTVAAAGGRG